MDYPEEQKIVIPSPKELEQIDEIDKTKVFWTIVLAIFIVIFVFVLGYWVGQQKVKNTNFDSIPQPETMDLNDLGAQAPAESLNTNNNTPSSEEADNLGAIDKSLSSDQKTALPDTTSSPLSDEELAQTPQTPSLPPQSPTSQNPKIVPLEKEQTISSNKVKSKTPIRKEVSSNLSPKGKWAVRLATVSNQTNALNLKKKIVQMGYSRVNVMKIGVLYRVSVLGFITPEKAKDFQKKVENDFHLTDTMIIKL